MYQLSYDEKLNILTIRLQGELEEDKDLRLLMAEVHASVDEIDKTRSMNRLFDLREFSISGFNAEMVQAAASILRSYNIDYNPIRIADLVSSDLMFGEHRALAVFSELPHIDRGVFRSLKAAQDWLLR